MKAKFIRLAAQNSESSVTTILLARHGKSVLNAEKRISGQADASLTEKGRRQADRLALALAPEFLTAIYCSPLIRARETAQRVAAHHELQVQCCDDLKEMSHGIFDGRHRDQRDAAAQQYWRERKGDTLRYRAPGGENLFDLQERVAPWARRMVDDSAGSTVLIVGHRNTNRALLSTLMGLPIEDAFAYGMHCGELYELRLGKTQDLRMRSVEIMSPVQKLEVRT